MKLSYEVKTGIIVAVSIGILYWGINFLKGRDFFSSQKKLFAVYHQIGGLAPSNPVMMNGMKIGSVREISIMDDSSQSILVTLFVRKDVKIPDNTIALIGTPDFLSGKTVTLLRGNSALPANDGDTLTGDVEKNMKDAVNDQVAPIKEKAENLLSSFDSVLAVVRNVFDERTKNNLKNSFESIANSVSSIEQITANLDTTLGKQGKLKTIFDNLASITTNLKNNNEKISKIIENFASISDTVARANLSATLDHTRKTLEETSKIFEKINKGEGSLGQLANNDSLYSNLNNSAHDLDELLKDLKLNPKRYINFSVVSIGGGKEKN